MQVFDFDLSSNEELDILAPRLPELQKVSFKHVKDVLYEIDENYPFSV